MKQFTTVDRTAENIKCPSNKFWLQAECWLVIHKHCITTVKVHALSTHFQFQRPRHGREGIKAGMCDAALCAPCTWAPLRWLVSLKRRYNKCLTFDLWPLTKTASALSLSGLNLNGIYHLHGLLLLSPNPFHKYTLNLDEIKHAVMRGNKQRCKILFTPKSNHTIPTAFISYLCIIRIPKLWNLQLQLKLP